MAKNHVDAINMVHTTLGAASQQQQQKQTD